MVQGAFISPDFSAGTDAGDGMSGKTDLRRGLQR